MECLLCALCPWAPPLPPLPVHQAWAPKVQGTSNLGLGGAGGGPPGLRNPGHGLQAAPASGEESPQPLHLLALLGHPV